MFDALRDYLSQLRRLSRHRSYRRLLIGGFISALGDRVCYIAFLGAITTLSENSLGIFAITIAEMLPALLVAPVVSLMVDRYDRRKLMLLADLARGVLFTLIVVFPSIWLLLLVAFLAAAFSTLFEPSRQALEPFYIPEGELVQAGGIRQGVMSVVMIAGPALGGLLVAILGYRAALLFDAITFFASAWFVLRLDKPHNAASEKGEGGWKEIIGGWQTVRSSAILRHLFGMFAAFTFVIGIQFPLIFVFVRENLHGGPTEAGWLISAVGVGGIVGGLLLAAMKKENQLFNADSIKGRRNLAFVVALDGLVVLFFAGLHSLVVVLGVFAVFGLIGTVLTTGLTAAISIQSPAQFRGRVFALYAAISGPLMVASIVLGAPLAQRYGAAKVFYVSGGLELIVGAIAWKRSSKPMQSALDAV